ncbi:MAG: hypothetical protein K9J83_01350 [Desulfarculaceae bacterium]|nr:hypothetical protein [Desulfarculaceae bacterium]
MNKQDIIPFIFGKDPDLDAWFTSFFLENHIDHFAYPLKAGSREQVEFMVYIPDNERYYPCSDHMFASIMSRSNTDFVEKRYIKAHGKIRNLIDELISAENENAFLKSLIQIKYNHEIQIGLIIPSRLEKRLFKIFVSRTHIEDPCSEHKRNRNQKARHMLDSEAFRAALDHTDESFSCTAESSLEEIKEKIETLELWRLCTLMGAEPLWQPDNPPQTDKNDFLSIFNTQITGNGFDILSGKLRRKKRRILWLSNEAGEIMMDIFMIQHLAGEGHTVILSVKDESFFTKVSIVDVHNDPALSASLENASFIHGKNLSKNSLVNMLKSNKNIFIVSDGTRENLNLLFVSTTFSRLFKEVDFVVSRGHGQKKRLFDSHFEFTQDIFSITNTADGQVCIDLKKKAESAVKFSHEALEIKAGNIIDQMKKAGHEKMTVMFYSGIVGSIPGKIDVAKKIMAVFIDHLQKESTNLFIINPSLYYEAGMDADDLMYMWEIVQRSGFIDIWRFQTADDISKSFALMNEKVPPEWIGKDATYSTGCTKEIKIAKEVQKRYPEMQIIGPSVEKFMRRHEYGVGSMHDKTLTRY